MSGQISPQPTQKEEERERGVGPERRSSDSPAEMVIRNPAPDASPSREPSGRYRIFKIAHLNP